MMIMVFKEGKENKAVLMNGEDVKLINWFESISDVYDFADKCSEKYNTEVNVEFVR